MTLDLPSNIAGACYEGELHHADVIVGEEPCSPSIEIDADGFSFAVTFSAKGDYLVGGGLKGVRVWRAADVKELTTLKAENVRCLDVSKNGRWISAGTWREDVFVWDAETYEQVLNHKESDHIGAVDFSPDSTRLVAAWRMGTANIWDIALNRQIQTLDHYGLKGATYSPDGNRIATANRQSVRIWDSDDGRLLVEIKVKVSSYYNKPLIWFRNHLFVISDNIIKEFDASTGTLVTECIVPAAQDFPCISLPNHGEFIAYSAKENVTFWDRSTHTQLGLIQRPQEVYSLAVSPDDRFVAVGGSDKIIIQELKDILPLPHPTVSFIYVTDTVTNSWQKGHLADAEASFTDAISNPELQSYHAFAHRALVRSRLHYSDLAINDADKSIKIQPSVIGYIAKSVTLIENGQKEEGCRVFDLAFVHCDRAHVNHLLLIKAVVLFTAGKCEDALSRIDDLVATVDYDTIYSVVQAYMYLILGDSHMENSDYTMAIHSFERARAQMRDCPGCRLLFISLIFGWKFDDLDITIRRRLCAALYAAGRTTDAAISLLDLINTLNQDAYTTGLMTRWISDFARQCLSTGKTGVAAESKDIYDSSIVPVAPNSLSLTHLLKEWAKATLVNHGWKDALVFTSNFVVSKLSIYRVICERLEITDRLTDVVECFNQMNNELASERIILGEPTTWVIGFRQYYAEKLERLGDKAVDGQRHDDAITHYSAALSLSPAIPQNILVKRSKAYIATGLPDAALTDANKVIEFDPSSPWGYERKHEALHMEGDYRNAINAYGVMLSKIWQSSDPHIRELYSHYTSPEDTRLAIRDAVQDVIHDLPRVLLDTNSGRLLDKSEQASAFESLPVYNKLISSMTTNIDHSRIEQDVTEYYRYAMFSHKWEDNEPLFDKVIRTAVYDLDESPTNNKLRMFCKTVRNAGLCWAWSDTCCINTADHFALQEALVSMFKWYQGASQTLVLLRGIRSPSRHGDLVKSIWNSRVWTFQEYHASQVVRFFNEDWTLYRGLNIPNHKESFEILSEMEEATGISTQALMALQPGLDDIREKLSLASRRETTLLEDEAYSLLGIFSISLPVVYGEGNQALGRLLSQLLTSSGDTSILAWSGNSGSFNSCLPARIRVFSQSLATYIPPAIVDPEMESITSRLRNTTINSISVKKFYDRLDHLRVPVFSGKRMTLPCITFKLGPLSVSRTGAERAFLAQTAALGIVEIKTAEDISRYNSLYLIHPWLDYLLDRQPVGSVVETIPEGTADDQVCLIGEEFQVASASLSNSSSTALRSRTTQLASRFGLSFSGGRKTSRHREGAPPRPPSSLSPTERQARALQVLARLRQPFGALLLAPSRNVAAFRRVATDSLITVQVEEITPTILDKLIDSISVLDVL